VVILRYRCLRATSAAERLRGWALSRLGDCHFDADA